MTLIRQSRLLAWLAALALAAVLVVTGVAMREVRDQTRESEMAELTAQGVNQFRYLIMETALYREQRASEQWQRRMASFRQALGRHRYSSARENALLARERENLDVLARLYARLVKRAALEQTGAEGASAQTASIVSMLFLTSQDMIEDAAELMRENRTDLQHAQERASWVVLGSVLLLAGLIGVCFFIIRKRVLRPVAALQGVTERVAAGDLSLRLRLSEHNEIGRLADSFDRMTEQLEESRARLLAENTERRQAQHALEQSVEQLDARSGELARARFDLQAIIDHTPALVMYWDQDLRNVFANSAYQQWFGLTPGEIHGRHMRDVVGSRRFSELETRLNSVLRGHAEMFEYTTAFSDGVVRDLLFSCVPDVANGVVRGFYGFVTDISQLKRAQSGQAEALARLQGMVDGAIDFAIMATDRSGTIELFSRGAERLLGYRAAEVIGHANLARFHKREEIAALGEALSRESNRVVAGFDVFVEGARHGQSETRDWHCVRRDGSEVEVSMSVTKLRDADGNPAGFLMIAKDISRDRAILRTLAAARDDAEAGSRAKTEFLANVSHEIRTPMNAILGLLRMLQQTGLDPVQRGYADNTQAAARSLLRLLNDILDFSKADTGKMTLECAPFSLRHLVDELQALAESLAAGRDIALRFEMDASLPDAVSGDALRLRQVLLNLIGNAIKFTPRGEVRIELARRDGRIEFAVQDTGIGIAPEQLVVIFDAFSQAEASTTRRYGGTGLGLAISQRLVQLMGATLEVSSIEGAGSRFWFALALPLADAVAAPVQPSAPGEPRLAGLRVLVVDDNALNRQVAEAFLESEGAQVALAEGGAEALALLRHPGTQVDLVVMDVQMPGMDGHAATRAIRADPQLAHLPVVAMTANAMAGDRQASLDAGMDDYLEKPIDLDRMVEVVLRHRGRPGAPAPLRPAATQIAGGAVRALQRLGGSEALFLSVGRNYPGDAREQGVRLQAALASGNWSAAARQAHSLRGVAGTVGADALVDYLAALEAALRAHPTGVDVEAQQAAVHGQVEHSIEELAQACAVLEARRAILAP